MNKIIVYLLLIACCCYAENIDPHENSSQFAYGENVGWINFEPNQGEGIQVSDDTVTGFVWAENIGWIKLSPTNYGGVVNDGNGNLSGFAWGENVGWINFNPQVPGDSTNYGVTIDSQGYFDGWAYGENIGWIRFDNAQSWSVQACVVNLEDLQNFASYWLDSGNVAGNIDVKGKVDNIDFSILASYWHDFCPDGWQLK